jgi:hypothetical protein
MTAVGLTAIPGMAIVQASSLLNYIIGMVIAFGVAFTVSLLLKYKTDLNDVTFPLACDPAGRYERSAAGAGGQPLSAMARRAGDGADERSQRVYLVCRPLPPVLSVEPAGLRASL